MILGLRLLIAGGVLRLVDGGTHGVPEVLEPEGLRPLPEVPPYLRGFRSDVCLGLMGSLGDRTPGSLAPVALAVGPSPLAAATLRSARPAVATATTPATVATAPALASTATATAASSSTTAPAAGSVGGPGIEVAEG